MTEQTFGQKLAQRRSWLGWTMTETACALEIQGETYRGWENGKHVPHALMQRGVLGALDDLALSRATAILTELSTVNSHSCCPSYPQGDRVPIDTNTRSSTGDH